MGRDRDCRDHQPTPFFFPGPPRSVCGASPRMCPWRVWLGFAIQSVMSAGLKLLGVISAWLILAYTQSLYLLRGLPCFHFPEPSSTNISCFGSLLSSMRMTCPTHQSRLFRIKASRLVDSAMSRTCRLKARSYHLMFRMICRLCIWKRSSCFGCLLYRIHVLQP